LLELLDGKPSQAVQLAVVGAVGSFNRPEVATRLLARYPALAASVRVRVLGLLCSRKEWVEPLIEAIAQGRLSPQELKAPQVLQIVQLGDSELTRRVEKAWGRVPGPGSPEKIRRIAEVRGILPEGDKGSAARGIPVFKENCAACHRLYDEGEQIGPDLTGAERNNLDFLLTSLVDPGASIRKEFEAQTAALADGRVLTGLVVEETDKTVTLVDSNRQKTVVPRDQVEEMKPSAVSLMPEGLLDKLRDDQVRDLFRYLQSTSRPK
jgi:putative heme-binding domain-containing protein